MNLTDCYDKFTPQQQTDIINFWNNLYPEDKIGLNTLPFLDGIELYRQLDTTTNRTNRFSYKSIAHIIWQYMDEDDREEACRVVVNIGRQCRQLRNMERER